MELKCPFTVLNDQIYSQIELKRKIRIENEIRKLLNHRITDRKNIIEEINIHNKNIYDKQRETEKASKIETKITAPDLKIESTTPQKVITQPLLSNESATKTNIPFSQELINNFFELQIIRKVEHENKYKKSQLMDIKRIVNKRLMQVSSDVDHINALGRDLQQYNQGTEFIEAFTSKMIEQSKVQVTKASESHKSLSVLFYLLYTQDLFDYYRYKVFCEQSLDNVEIHNVYLIYFCVLKAKKNFEEAWFFLASVLNVTPIETTLYVLDAFLMIFAKEMKSFYGNEYSKVVEFLKNTFMSKLDNDPLKYRILSHLEI